MKFACSQETGTKPFFNDCLKDELVGELFHKQYALKRHHTHYRDQQTSDFKRRFLTPLSVTSMCGMVR